MSVVFIAYIFAGMAVEVVSDQCSVVLETTSAGRNAAPLAYSNGIRKTAKTAVGSAEWRGMERVGKSSRRDLNRLALVLPDPRGVQR